MSRLVVVCFMLLAMAGCSDSSTPTMARQPPAVSSPGCAFEGDRHRRPAVRIDEPPARAVPFFAPRTGALPPDGTPTIGGVRLPKGSRCVNHWATDKPTPDAVNLASQLAAVFPQTGLWPVLWDVASEDPDTHVSDGAAQPTRIPRIAPETVLRGLWEHRETFDGLAEGSPGAPVGDPFRRQFGLWPFGRMSKDGWFVVLVPVTRPADAVSVLNVDVTRSMQDEEMSAVLRSWEERFGAVLTNMSPGAIGVVVDRPPMRPSDALRLADEHEAFQTEQEQPFSADQAAQRLRVGEVAAGVTRSRNFWIFIWPG